MANLLTVTANVTVSVGSNTQSFTVGQEVDPTSIYARTLLYSGFAVDSGNPAPNPSTSDFFSALSDSVRAVYYGNNPNTSRPKARFVIWIGSSAVTPVNAYATDARVVSLESPVVGTPGGLGGGANGTYAPLGGRVDGARALVHQMADGVEGGAVICLGDSTGNGAGEWFHELFEWLGGQFSAYSIVHRLWNDTNQGYDRPTIIQSGTGGQAYANLPSGAVNSLSIPDSTLNSITGDFSAVLVFEADAYTGFSGEFDLFNKFGGGGNRSWRLYLNTTGIPYLQWSADGTNLVVAGAGTAIPSGKQALGVTLDVDNGSTQHVVKFWTASVDASGTIGTWSQLGSTVTTAGTTSIFDSTQAVLIGNRGANTVETLKVYYAELRSGANIDSSPIVLSVLPGLWKSGTTFSGGEGETVSLVNSATIVGAPTLVLYNASTSGQAITYSTDATRFAKQTPVKPAMSFISYSHNGGTTATYDAQYAGLIDQLLTKYPYADVCAVTQNPKKSPQSASAIREHASRNRQIVQAAATKNIMLADVYAAFIATGDPDFYVDADGIHPADPAGLSLWLDTVKALFTPWVSAVR